MRAADSAALLLLLAFPALVAVACGSQRPEPCATVRCGYGSVCEVDQNNRPKCVCPTVCPAIYQPVCGSDGKTYSNTCQMNVAACQQQKEILKVGNGDCSETSTGMPLLPTRISPGIGLPKFGCSTPKPTCAQAKLIEELYEED